MPEPTLADFAAALDRIRERWPDAPGLPDGYYFKDIGGIGTVLYLEYPPASADLVAKHAAIALCTVTAFDNLTHWESRDYDNDFDIMWLPGSKQWQWTVGENEGRADSLPSAALAMLVGIGGGDAD